MKFIFLFALVLSSCSVHRNGIKSTKVISQDVESGKRGVASAVREVRCSTVDVNKQHRAQRDGLHLLEHHLSTSCDLDSKFSTSVIKEKGEVTGYLACCTPALN